MEWHTAGAVICALVVMAIWAPYPVAYGKARLLGRDPPWFEDVYNPALHWIAVGVSRLVEALMKDQRR